MEPEPQPPFVPLEINTKRRKRPIVVLSTVVIILIIGGILFGAYSWYQGSLSAVDVHSKNKIRFVVEKGETTSQIGQSLQKKGLIRSSQSFELYIKFNRPTLTLQAGTYTLSKSFSVQKIISQIESGKTEQFLVKILPGATLDEIRNQLQKYGYKKEEINKAFSARYDTPLLASKPATADLEGYIFPETYQVQPEESLTLLLRRDFDNFFTRLQKDSLLDTFRSRNLNFHQALTLASIVQKETSNPEDQRKVAQVLYKRLGSDMKLETDPTFVYASKKAGVPPDINIDSPYNTRRYKGLPPGPIANVNYSALQAVANPAPTDYLYFVAGDNGVNYFSHTLEEHENNVREHCLKLCQQ